MKIVTALVAALLAVVAITTPFGTGSGQLWCILAAGVLGFAALMWAAVADGSSVPGPRVTVTAVAALARRPRPAGHRPQGAALGAAPKGALTAGKGAALARRSGALARRPQGALLAPPVGVLPGHPDAPGAPVLGVVLHVAVPPWGAAPDVWQNRPAPVAPALPAATDRVIPGQVIR